MEGNRTHEMGQSGADGKGHFTARGRADELEEPGPGYRAGGLENVPGRLLGRRCSRRGWRCGRPVFCTRFPRR